MKSFLTNRNFTWHNCGTPVLGGSAVCKECGFAFQNIKVNSFIEKLQEKLEKLIKSDADVKDKMLLISSFPVPNTRADLLDCLASLKMKSSAIGPVDGGSSGENLSFAYWELFCNCIEKAKISFANDKDFIPFFNKYETELKKSKTLWGRWSHMNSEIKFLVSLFIIHYCYIIMVFAISSENIS